VPRLEQRHTDLARFGFRLVRLRTELLKGEELETGDVSIRRNPSRPRGIRIVGSNWNIALNEATMAAAFS
jgi:hypothetical protein